MQKSVLQHQGNQVNLLKLNCEQENVDKIYRATEEVHSCCRSLAQASGRQLLLVPPLLYTHPLQSGCSKNKPPGGTVCCRKCLKTQLCRCLFKPEGSLLEIWPLVFTCRLKYNGFFVCLFFFFVCVSFYTRHARHKNSANSFLISHSWLFDPGSRARPAGDRWCHCAATAEHSTGDATAPKRKNKKTCARSDLLWFSKSQVTRTTRSLS